MFVPFLRVRRKLIFMLHISYILHSTLTQQPKLLLSYIIVALPNRRLFQVKEKNCRGAKVWNFVNLCWVKIANNHRLNRYYDDGECRCSRIKYNFVPDHCKLKMPLQFVAATLYGGNCISIVDSARLYTRCWRECIAYVPVDKLLRFIGYRVCKTWEIKHL